MKRLGELIEEYRKQNHLISGAFRSSPSLSDDKRTTN